jgi:hypothetical protein
MLTWLHPFVMTINYWMVEMYLICKSSTINRVYGKAIIEALFTEFPISVVVSDGTTIQGSAIDVVCFSSKLGTNHH